MKSKFLPVLPILAITLGASLACSLRASNIAFDTFSATPYSWATVDTLNNLPLSLSQNNNLSLSVDSLTTLTLTGNSAIKTGTLTSGGILGTAPNYASSAQALYFGQSSAAGADKSAYLSVSTGGSATFTFNTGQSYLGLLWGTPDSYNTLSFYNGSTLLGSMTGSPLISSYGYGYVNITTTTPFDSVVLTSSGNSFEVDNIAHSAFALAPAAPAPPMTACLAFSGVLLLQTLRRNQQAA